MISKKSINRVILVGNVGMNPELNYTSSGFPVASFSLATNEIWIDVEKKKIEHTEWHNVVAWNKLAEFSNKYLHKGQSIYLEGKIHTSSWEDEQQGYKKTRVEIICSNIIPLEWKNNADAGYESD